MQLLTLNLIKVIVNQKHETAVSHFAENWNDATQHNVCIGLLHIGYICTASIEAR